MDPGPGQALAEPLPLPPALAPQAAHRRQPVHLPCAQSFDTYKCFDSVDPTLCLRLLEAWHTPAPLLALLGD
eukprot:11402166-Alexandrium_andersonii.AAC.1